jgi:hypothetical protein
MESLTTSTLDMIRSEGVASKRAGASRISPFMTEEMNRAWLDGYDSVAAVTTLCKVWPSGGPIIGGDS